MKTLIAIIMLLTSLSIFACTDFSGTYQSDDGQQFTMVQDQCRSITLTDENGTYTAIADGVYHESMKQEIIIEGQRIGTMTLFSKLSFANAIMNFDLRAKIEAMGQAQEKESNSVSVLNANNDLESLTTQDGTTKKVISILFK